MELARNLSTLVEQLKALREDMGRKSELYDALLPMADGSESNSSILLDQNHSGMRGSVFTLHSDSVLEPRASEMSCTAVSALDDATDDANSLNTLVSRRSSTRRRQQHRTSLRPHPQPHMQSYLMSHMPMERIGLKTYMVMWVSGECGISLRNFSRKDNRVGAQIAVLQHANGITTGIYHCRLGDELVSINDERVDQLRFKEIVKRLKTTRRPISLEFRTNQNLQTSPRAASSPSDRFNSDGGSRSSFFSKRGSMKNKKSLPLAKRSVSVGSISSMNVVFDDESSDFVHETLYPPNSADLPLCGAAALDRMTTRSLSMSEVTLSDDVEKWCRAQEEMHCDIVVLLTETVMYCEKLQQENLDQLQNLMQLSLCSPPFSNRSSVASSCVNDGPDLDAVVSDATSGQRAEST